jgi:hypothetical protein
VSQIDRKALRRAYKETPRPAGIYGVRNTVSGKSLVGSTANLPGMLNRQRFELEQGVHPDKELQNDWNTLGVGAFEFETLDRLEPKTEPAYDLAEDLCALKEMWIEQLTAAGVPLYRWSRQGKGA